MHLTGNKMPIKWQKGHMVNTDEKDIFRGALNLFQGLVFTNHKNSKFQRRLAMQNMNICHLHKAICILVTANNHCVTGCGS